MKEGILDVLMYLFENYMDEDVHLHQDQEALKSELSDAGFPGQEINKAFTWLEGLTDQPEPSAGHTRGDSPALRVYTDKESDKLDVDCRGFLLFLEQLGVLNCTNRELIIDRVMALNADDISLEQLKWVILMVLFNQPGQEAAFTWMENLVYNPVPSTLN